MCSKRQPVAENVQPAPQHPDLFGLLLLSLLAGNAIILDDPEGGDFYPEDDFDLDRLADDGNPHSEEDDLIHVGPVS